MSLLGAGDSRSDDTLVCEEPVNQPAPPPVSPHMRRVHGLLIGAPVLLLAACSSGGSPAAAPPPAAEAPTAAATSGGPVLMVAGYKFPPLTVAPGTRISLVDGDDEPHTVTATDGSFNSGTFDKSKPGSLIAPTRPGSYAFTCTVHPSMHGTLVVR